MYTVTVTNLYSDDATGSQRTYQIQKNKITIGRARNNDIVLRQTNISTKHASITKSEQGFFLEDLNSTNGTLLNEIPVHNSCRIYSDDQIDIGGSTLRLSGHPALARSSGEAGQGVKNREDSYPFDSYTSNSLQEKMLPTDSIPDATSQPPASSISLDSLFPYQDSQILKLEQMQNDQNAVSTFPVDDNGEPRVSPPQAKKPSPNLVDKIRKLESQVIKEKRKKTAPKQQNIPSDDAVSSPFPTPLSKAPEQTDELISVTVSSLEEPHDAPATHKFGSLSVLVGRDENCEIVLAHSHVSSHHAIIENVNSELLIRDLNSKNGTIVERKAIRAPTTIDPTDQVIIARFVLNASIIRGKLEEPVQEYQSQPLKTLTQEPDVYNEDIAPIPADTGDEAASFTAKDKDVVPSAGKEKLLSESDDGNLQAISIQLHLARKAVGAALEKAQNTGEDVNRIKEICAVMAKAVRELFSIKSSVGQITEIREAVDSSVQYLSKTLMMAGQTAAFSTVNNDIIRALSLIYPFSTDNLKSDFVGLSPHAALSVQTEQEMGLSAPRSVYEETENEAFIEHDYSEGELIAKFMIGAEYEYLASVRALSSSIADIFFFDEQQSLRLQNVIDEACTNAIDHAFEPPDTGIICVSFFLKPKNEIAIAIDDQGMPFDTEKAESGELDGLGITLMRAFCKEIHFVNRGRKGKRVILIVELPERQSDIFEQSQLPTFSKESITGSSKYEIRFIKADQAEEITRCVFRANKYDYYDELLYHSEKLKKLVQNGRQISAMAFTDKDAAIGHVSVTLESTNSKTGELGHSVVVPQLSAGNLTSKLTMYVIDECRASGFWGLTSKLKTAHPYEQIAFTSLGGVPTGLLLGHISEASRHRRYTRQTALFAFLKLNQGILREVYLPSQHYAMLRKIYDELGLERNLKEEPQTEKESMLSAISSVEIEASSSLGVAYIKIKEYGDDFTDVIEAKLNELRKSFYCIYLDLPLQKYSTKSLFSQIEKHRFFFSCLVPETVDGDVLRLQSISNFEVIHQDIHIDGNFGKILLEYIKNDQARNG